MAFWFALLWWIGTSIVSALLAKPQVENARPSGLDDFQVPTATEGRSVPIIVGKVKMSGPNVAWYGDLLTVALKEKVGGFFGIGAKSVTKAFEYNIGVQMVISSGPIDGYDRVWMGDKELRSGETSGNSSFDDRELFGGEDSGGGIEFTLQFFNGADDQLVSTYLDAQLVNVPAYLNTAYMLLNDGAGGPGYIGNQATLRNMAFEPFWFPNTLGVTGGKERIGEDANPICFLFEMLAVNDDWGVQMPASDILINGTVADGAFLPVAEQVFDEGLGFSMVIDSQMPAADLINEIERHVDGKFRLDLTDGKFKITLARPETGSVPLLDESNVLKLTDFARPTWADTFNQVRISYADRAKEYDRTSAIDQDLANLDILGGRSRVHMMSFPGVKTATVANIIAAREMFSLGSPSARCKVEVEGSQYKLFVGQAVEFSWADHEISELPMRISRIKYGRDVSAAMTLDMVEDAFRLEPPGFTNPPLTDWVAPNVDAQPALDARIWKPPTQLEARPDIPVLLIARDGGLHLEYDIYIDPDGGDDFLEYALRNEALPDWTPIADLVGAMSRDLDGPPHYEQTVTIDNVVDLRFSLLDDAASTTVNGQNPTNIFLIDDEMFWFESVVDLGGGSFELEVSHRGAFGTIPADHLDNERIWFPGFGAGLLVPFDTTAFILFQPFIRVRATPRTATGTLDLASAPPIPLGFDYNGTFSELPYAPGDMQVNGELFVDEDWTRIPGVARVIWRNRNRTTQALDTLQDDQFVASDGTVGVRVRVRRVDTDAIVSSVDFATAGQFTGEGFIPVSVEASILGQGGSGHTLGVIDELDFYIEAQAILAGRLSQLWRCVDHEVFGFGIDFGADFGGQDTGGPNLGVVLSQADAPRLLDPVPTVPGQTRTFTMTVAGTTSTVAEKGPPRLFFTGFDTQAQEIIGTNFTMSNTTTQTPSEMAAEIQDQLNIALEGRPFTVSREANVVSIVTNFGDLSFRGTNGSFFGFSTLWARQDAVGAQVGVQQVAYLEYNDVITNPNPPPADLAVLAPATDPSYLNPGIIRLNTKIRGLTEEANSRLAANGTRNGLGFVSVITTGAGLYDANMGNLVTMMNNHGLAEFWVASGPGIVTGLARPMQRASVVLELALDFDLQEDDALNKDGNTFNSSDFHLGWKLGKVARAEGPIPKVMQTGFGHRTLGVISMTGVVLNVTLDGEVFSSTILAPGFDGAIQDAVTDLADQMNAGSTYSASVFIQPQPFSFTTSLTITGPDGVDFEGFNAGSNGPRFEFRRSIN